KSAPGFLLSVYDEYTIAYHDRSLLADSRDIEKMLAMGSSLTSVIILNNTVAGTRKKTIRKKSAEDLLKPFGKLSKRQQNLLKSAVIRYAEFTGYPAFLAKQSFQP